MSSSSLISTPCIIFYSLSSPARWPVPPSHTSSSFASLPLRWDIQTCRTAQGIPGTPPPPQRCKRGPQDNCCLLANHWGNTPQGRTGTAGQLRSQANICHKILCRGSNLSFSSQSLPSDVYSESLDESPLQTAPHQTSFAPLLVTLPVRKDSLRALHTPLCFPLL